MEDAGNPESFEIRASAALFTDEELQENIDAWLEKKSSECDRWRLVCWEWKRECFIDQVGCIL